MKILYISHSLNVYDGWGRYTNDLKNVLSNLGNETYSLAEIMKAKGAKISPPLSYLMQPLSVYSPFRIIKDIIIIRSIIKQIRPDIIHFTVEPMIVLLPFLGIKNTPVFLTVHGTYSYIPNVVNPVFKKIYSYIYSKAVEKTNLVISVSEFTKNYLLNNIKTLNNKITVINNGIDINKHIYNNDRAINQKKIIITVGAIKRRKGIIQILRALSVFKKKYNIPFEYRIIGSYREDDLYFKEIINCVKENNLDENVRFLGKVGEDVLNTNYESADLFMMLPTIDGYKFEGFGLVYLEANSYGVPTIGSKGTCADEAISDFQSGFVCDPSSSNDLAYKMFCILNDNCISSESCISWARQHDIEIVGKKYRDIYEKYLN